MAKLKLPIALDNKTGELIHISNITKDNKDNYEYFALFDDDMSKWYNFSIDIQEKSGKEYYVFSAEGKSEEEGGDSDKLVIDKMTTWFDYKTMDVVSRTYSLSYSARVYSFNVYMEVDLSRYKTLLVPTVIRYNGEWRVFPKSKERGVFTATLTDFGGR